MSFLQQLVGQYMIDSGEKIISGNCGLCDAELQDLASSIMHVELKKAEAAKFLNISPRTFDRKISVGEIPEGVHEMHHKELIWYKDELLPYLCKTKESL